MESSEPIESCDNYSSGSRSSENCTSVRGAIPKDRIPEHVAIIMDGNGRWAASQGLPRVAGHQRGVETVRTILQEGVRHGIRFITLYAFSSENWFRPKDEVDALMLLFSEYLIKEQPTFLNEGIRLRAIGDRSRLPAQVVQKLELCEAETAHCEKMTL
ncbi:MAG: di-trans,poly-cis-decaprenylcistransferase, partial [Bdellovibrionales bacterium]|nr:di-trans,poly-cis-decaprenylcistransferase [Bdellovibrionales bacterium]